MAFSIQIKLDASEFKKALERSPIELKQNLKSAMQVGMKEVKQEAQRNHRFISRSNMLERSISDEVNKDGTVGKVFLDTNIAAYGPFQHEGTTDHDIKPKNKKVLSFVSGGSFVFAKKTSVRGIRPDRFLVKALASKSERLAELFNKAIKSTLEKIRFKSG